MREFAARQPELDFQWFRGSNNLVVLQVEDKGELDVLIDRAEALEIPCVYFHEPDLGGALTAAAFAAEAKFILRSLPLALRELRSPIAASPAGLPPDPPRSSLPATA
jgi:hypothetical protein